MDKETRVIGIEVEALKEIIHGLVRDEMSKIADHIISALRPSKTDLVEGRLYTTNEVAEILGGYLIGRSEGLLWSDNTNRR
jgi:hypothetical protein